MRVASGDVNGDGQADMITAPGAGGGPHVRIFDGRTGAVIREFFAFEGNVTGGLHVAAGDINLDGRAEVFVGADGPNSGARVRIFNGQTGALISERTPGDAAAAFAGGVRVAAGDINGDGRSDLILGAGPGNTPRVIVMDANTGQRLADFFAYSPGFGGGIYIAAGDVNRDGIADIVTGADSGGGPHVRIFDGVSRQEIRSYFAYGFTFTGGVRVATTDFNADGVADIITGAGPGGGPHVRIVSGDTLAPLAGFFAYAQNFTGGVYVGGSIKGPGSPLRSMGNATGDSADLVVASQLRPLVDQAVAGWAAQGADAGLLRRIDVRVADLPDGYLGMAFANAIYVDVDADGHGWYVDETPDTDEEFEGIDLLSVIAHELGHVLGLDDLSMDDHDADLMAEALPAGTRRSPAAAVDAVFGSEW